MARPEKKKRICKKPGYTCFSPKEQSGNRKCITLTVDEYEAIRLIDLEGVSREECAERMNIARTTAQAIYNSARRKTAELLVNGCELSVAGGAVTLCEGDAGCPECSRRNRCGGVQSKNVVSDSKELNNIKSNNTKVKGINSMRIAVTYENGKVFQHFGHTENFKVYDVEGTEIKNAEIYGSNGAGHGALAEVLYNSGVNVLICGGLGAGALNALTEAGIKVIAGASGDVDDAVDAYLAGKLESTGANCGHHDHGEGHSCGNHGCH